MPTDLKSEILANLEGSSASRPVDTAVLAKGHHRSHVEAALMALYQARQIYCCKIIKGQQENVVWWRAGTVAQQTEFYGKNKPTAPAQPRKRTRRISPLSSDVRDLVRARPGVGVAEVLAAFPQHDTARVRQSLFSLKQCGYIRFEGEPRKFRYYPEAAK